jgi:hypothetical protein
MSSATSIERRLRVNASEELLADGKLPPKGGSHTSTDRHALGKATHEGFRPSHFFVLASLAASTVAVILSRQSAPEHLILLSLTIGAAGAAAAAVYRTIVPFTVRDASLLSQRPSERARAALEREKALVLRSIKELEFDRAMGKVSARDFDEMAGRLRARAMALMKQLDAGGSGYREAIERELSARLQKARAGSPEPAEGSAAPAAVRHCASCETVNDSDAAFCKRCGTALRTVL